MAGGGEAGRTGKVVVGAGVGAGIEVEAGMGDEARAGAGAEAWTGAALEAERESGGGDTTFLMFGSVVLSAEDCPRV